MLGESQGVLGVNLGSHEHALCLLVLFLFHQGARFLDLIACVLEVKLPFGKLLSSPHFRSSKS